MPSSRPHRIVLIATGVVVAVLLASVALVHPRGGHAAPHRPLPTCCIPVPRAAAPAGFQLTVAGTVDQGATVTVQIGAANYPGLILARELDDGRLAGPDPTSATATGLVPLGELQPGTSQLPWDLTLNGTPLAAGPYLVFLGIFEADGRPAGLLPAPQYAQLTIGADGTVTVSMARTADLAAQAASPTPTP